MADKIYGREKEIKNLIKKYSEADEIGNIVFLGPKGIGKTTLFHKYFRQSKLEELATKQKFLFCYSQLTKEEGENLDHFLLNMIKSAMNLLPETEKTELKKKITSKTDGMESSAWSILEEYGKVITDEGYQIIFILDHFHILSRETKVGEDQYTRLRVLNGKIKYWIITDTDLVEEGATEDFLGSFFVTNFSNKKAVCPIIEEERLGVINSINLKKQIELDEEELELVKEVSEGVPALMDFLLSIAEELKDDMDEVEKEDMINAALRSKSACCSLFRSWCTGLSKQQKEILYKLAECEGASGKENGLEMQFDDEDMTTLLNKKGRGLIRKEGKNYSINIELFKKYILKNREEFCPKEEIVEIPKEEKNDVPKAKEQNKEGDKGYTFYGPVTLIQGNYIEKQVNVSIQNAVGGLEKLQSLMESSSLGGRIELIKDTLSNLPTGNMNEQQSEEYIDSLLKSKIFGNGELLQEQKERFNLSDEILNAMDPDIKRQIVCGIQIYDLIELCKKIANFKLESEAPRGILFARAFELHLKKIVTPMFERIEVFANHLYKHKSFVNLGEHEKTIGVYSTMIERYVLECAQCSTQVNNKSVEEENVWWTDFSKKITRIKDHRNDCCHPTNIFGEDQLTEMIELLFKKKSWSECMIFKEIDNMQIDLPQICEPVNSLIGTQAIFWPREKKKNGSFKGVIFVQQKGWYRASFSKRYAQQYVLEEAKKNGISICIDTISYAANEMDNDKYSVIPL